MLEFDADWAEQIIPTMKPRDTESPMSTVEYHILIRELLKRFIDREHYLIPDHYGRVHTPSPDSKIEMLPVHRRATSGEPRHREQPTPHRRDGRTGYYQNRDVARRLRERRFRPGNPYHRRTPGHTGHSRADRPDLAEYRPSASKAKSMRRPSPARTVILSKSSSSR